jgi:hypothetical protein
MSSQGTRNSALAAISEALTRVVQESTLTDEEKNRWLESIQLIDDKTFLSNVVSLVRGIVQRIRPSESTVNALSEAVSTLANGWKQEVESIEASRAAVGIAHESLRKQVDDETVQIQAQERVLRDNQDELRRAR